MDLVLILMVLAAQINFWFVVKHVEGKANSLADNLSHDNPPQFISQVPQAEYNKPRQVCSTITPELSGVHPLNLDIH